MKSLIESIFDKDLAKNSISISNLFDIDEWCGATGTDEVFCCDLIDHHLLTIDQKIWNDWFKEGTGKYSKYLKYDINDERFGSTKGITLSKSISYATRKWFLGGNSGYYALILWLITWFALSAEGWNEKDPSIKAISEWIDELSVKEKNSNGIESVKISLIGKPNSLFKRALVVVRFKNKRGTEGIMYLGLNEK